MQTNCKNSMMKLSLSKIRDCVQNADVNEANFYENLLIKSLPTIFMNLGTYNNGVFGLRKGGYMYFYITT